MLASSTLTIKIYGQSVELRTRFFDLIYWNQLLELNRLDYNLFESHILDPDFFENYNFPDENTGQRALTFRRFMRSAKYGTDLSCMAIIEIKYGGKKVYKGSLNSFCGIDTFFPIIKINDDFMQVNPGGKGIAMVFIEKSAGLIFSAAIKVHSFTISDIQLQRTQIERLDFISAVLLNHRPIIHYKTETLVRGRSFQLLTKG